MAVTVTAVNRRQGDEAKGIHLGDYDSFLDAFRAVGEWIDKGEDRESVCVYLRSDNDRVNWTILSQLT